MLFLLRGANCISVNGIVNISAVSSGTTQTFFLFFHTADFNLLCTSNITKQNKTKKSSEGDVDLPKENAVR